MSRFQPAALAMTVGVALFSSYVGFATRPAIAQTAEQKPMQRTITISASARVSAEPDVARITTGVATEADTARDALAKNSDTMKKLIAALKASGVDAKDIATSQLQIDPRYTNPRDGQAPRINGYRVTNQVTITQRNPAKLGDVLDQLVALGANQMGGLTFDVSTAETLKDDARKQAFANARRRAELYAASSGAAMGPVLTISEETANRLSHGPMVMSGRAAMAEAVPVEAGTQELEVRVTVTWALN